MIIMCRHGAYDIKELRGLGKTLGLVYTKNLTLKRRLKKMNFLQTKLNEMKKRNEEGNKGFSLVELIIVIAIMAILVGIVGTQVIPYINKSKESKDLQIINSYSTAAVTAYSENADKLKTAADETITINVYGSNSDDAATLAPQIKEKTYANLKKADGSSDKSATLLSKMKSTKGKSIAAIQIKIDLKDKKVTTQAYSDAACTTGKEVFDAVEADL